MSRLVRLSHQLVRSRYPLWGSKWILAGYGFGFGYLLIVIGGIDKRPELIAVGIAVSLVVELSNVLPRRRKMRITRWHLGLERRTWWRIALVAGALGMAGHPDQLIASVVMVGGAYQFLSRLIRSQLFALDTNRRVRAIGSLREGKETLTMARRIAYRRNMVQVYIQSALAVVLAMLAMSPTLAWTNTETALATLAVSEVAGFMTLTVAVQARRMRKRLGARFDNAVMAAFREFDPEVICYLNGDQSTIHVLNVWLKVFAASKHRIAVVLRHKAAWKIESDQIPGVVVQRSSHLESLTSQATSVALYPTNGIHNAHMLRDLALTHVFIGHGDSDKSASIRPINRSYDKLWVAGQAAIDRYDDAGIEIPAGRFDIVGRPLLCDRVRQHAKDDETEDIHHARWMAHISTLDDGAKPPLTILYAPTTESFFEDANYTSVDTIGPTMITTILNEFPDARVMFKPHPQSGHRLSSVRKATSDIRRILSLHPGTHIWKPHSRVDLLYWLDLTDVLITDISSVASDWLQWDRPLVITNPRQLPHQKFESQFPISQGAHVLAGDGSDIAAILNQTLQDDPMAEQRHRMQSHYLGDHAIDPMDTFDSALDRLIRCPPRRVSAWRSRVDESTDSTTTRGIES